MMVSAMEANVNLDDPLHSPSDDSLKLQNLISFINEHKLCVIFVIYNKQQHEQTKR